MKVVMIRHAQTEGNLKNNMSEHRMFLFAPKESKHYVSRGDIQIFSGYMPAVCAAQCKRHSNCFQRHVFSPATILEK